jgi:hypothetical protein
MWRLLWFVVSVLTLATGLWVWNGRAHVRAAPREYNVPVGGQKAKLVEHATAASTTSAASKSSSRASPASYAAGYGDADDLLAYLNRLAPAANFGDAHAMYWMFRASRRCTRDYALYLGGPERSRSLERALEINAAGRMDEKSTREIYARCAAFKAALVNPYRDWRALLVRASQAGSPVAQATLADEMRGDAMRAGEGPAKARVEGQMLGLARTALRSKDPGVLIALAGVAATRVKPTDTDANGGSWQVDDTASVWTIAACQRGFDCSVDAEDFRYVCQLDDACQPFDTVIDMIRRRRPEQFSELELRASELNAKLDADDFDDIDL